MAGNLATYDINLDLDPSERWKHVMTDYNILFKEVMVEIDSIITGHGILGSVINVSSDVIYRLMNNIMYKEELQSISKLANIPMNKLILCQIIYEIFSACTSVVIRGENNIHFRTMDWEMDFLKKITIKVRFMKNNKLLYEAVTWVGYVGIVTGMSRNHSIAVNYRQSDGSFMGSMWRIISFHWPIGYLIRDILENNYDTVKTLRILSNSKLVSPCYITLCPGKGDAYIITRDHDKLVSIRNFNESTYIVQTNCDDINDENNIMWSKERMYKVDRIMNRNDISDQSHITVSDIFDMFSKTPIINIHTIYSTVMVPEKGILSVKLV